MSQPQSQSDSDYSTRTTPTTASSTTTTTPVPPPPSTTTNSTDPTIATNNTTTTTESTTSSPLSTTTTDTIPTKPYTLPNIHTYARARTHKDNDDDDNKSELDDPTLGDAAATLGLGGKTAFFFYGFVATVFIGLFAALLLCCPGCSGVYGTRRWPFIAGFGVGLVLVIGVYVVMISDRI